MKKLVIIGASGQGKVSADIAERMGYQEIVFLDDNIEIKKCGAYPVAGTTQNIDLYEDADFSVAIGDAVIRYRIQKMLEVKNYSFSTLIHPNATIASDVKIGNGTVVAAGAVINSGTTIGRGCIINTCASVDHDNVIGDFVHFAVGSHTAGTVRIGEGTCLGIGAVVSNNINICSGCMIGAGAVVIKDIKVPGTYVGVPAERKS